MFITGVSGFLGQELLSLLAREPVARIYCHIRASRGRSGQARLAEVLTECGLGQDGRIEAVEGDLRQERMGLPAEFHDRLSAEVTHIIHSAADVRFSQPLDKMRAINVEGVRQVLELAGACRRRNPRFSHVDYVSTAFVAGRRLGVVQEDLSDRFGFKNIYEQTKYEAEELVAARQAELPIIVYRPSILIGASETGKAKPRNVMYPLLRLFSRWRWPIVPIHRRVHLDVVPVDFAARAILALSREEKNQGGRFHLAAGPEGDLELGRMLEMVQEEYGRRVLVMPIPAWRYLVRPGLRLFRRRFYAKARPVFGAFEAYLWEPGPRYDTRRTRAALAGTGIELPDTERFLRACLRYAREIDFGARAPEVAR